MQRILGGMKLWGTLTSCLLFLHCGSDDHASSVSSVGDTDSIFLVAMGGNTSCGTDANGRPTPYRMDMYRNFESLVENLRAQNREAIRYIASCHTSEATVYYATSDEPETIFAEEAEDFYATVDGLALRDRSRVFMAGHSYGGWLTMKTVLHTSFDYEGVFTLDPISRITCTFVNPWGCTSAPGDLGNEDRQFIADRSMHWHNFYQTQTFYLHSGEIAHADVNTDLRIGHNSVDTDERVWQAIAARVTPAALATN